MIRLICTDIDGTLLNKERNLSDLTIHVLKKASEAVPIVLASSRMPSAMRYFQDTIGISGAPLICYNGGLVLGSENKVLYSATIGIEAIQRIQDLTSNSNVNVSTYIMDCWYTTKDDYWSGREVQNTKVPFEEVAPLTTLIGRIQDNTLSFPHKIMCMGSPEDIADIYEALQNEFQDMLNLYPSKPTYLEITNIHINKASALQKLINSEFNGVEASNIIAFGDNVNDLELLQFSGISVAVDNATEDVKKVATEITESNVNDGVALCLMKKMRIDL